MCGIVGYVGPKPVVPLLVDGLRRLEYRGYDSAGLAVVRAGAVELRRAAGKLARLEEVLAADPLDGEYGIGHTRWATHGRPTEENAHPHRDCTGRIVVIHNGIIENYLDLKRELSAEGHRFVTETDTEVVAHLVEREMRGDGLERAVRRALESLRGRFALVLSAADDPGKIVAVRNGPPLVVGLGHDEFFVASDVPALLAHTRDVVFLDDGEVAVVTREGATFAGADGRPREKAAQRVTWDPVQAEKAGYKHFMLKEIFEQPWAVRETTLGRASVETGEVFLGEVTLPEARLREVDRVVILACGTSWHAGLVAKFMIEELAGLPVEVDYGSEFRYRRPIVTPRTLAVVITQSGETADTLAALREARRRGALSLAVCNVVGSMATRESDGTVYTHAGPEIGVASTKAFTSQLVALQLIAAFLGRARGALSADQARPHLEALTALPILLEQALKCDAAVEAVAGRFCQRRDFLYLGRGINYRIALEGALKLKEVSYVHAEGYAAGEMKHGPIALIDEKMPVIVITPNDSSLERIQGNVQEALARGGKVVTVCTKGETVTSQVAHEKVEIPPCMEELSPFVSIVPLQLLAYHVADIKGTDVDQPRNLAKTVTVE
jgi:glucosamine--fructose-6-phosphate aminotransferase (isomerizing)